MNKILFLNLLIIFPIINIFAEVDVTSTIDGGIVRYIAPIGSIIKKGDLLVKFDTDIIKNGIEINKVALAKAYRDFNDQTLDYNRSSKLLPSHSISVQQAENDYFRYKESELEYEHLKLELNKRNILLTHYTIKAPRDCKVIKLYISENSGTEVGDKILQIEYLHEANKTLENQK